MTRTAVTHGRAIIGSTGASAKPTIIDEHSSCTRHPALNTGRGLLKAHWCSDPMSLQLQPACSMNPSEKHFFLRRDLKTFSVSSFLRSRLTPEQGFFSPQPKGTCPAYRLRDKKTLGARRIGDTR